MSVFRAEEHRFKEEFIHADDKELASIGRECRLSDRTVSPRSHMEQEKRIRREIANSNERRRMQSINAGFQSLRTLLPSHEGEKLSKAAILQQTAEYIYVLEQEKTRLLSQNCQLKRLLNQHEGEVSAATANLSKKRKLESAATTTVTSVNSTTSVVCESADEGIGSMSPEPAVASTVVIEGDLSAEHLRRDLIDLRLQLDRERRLRMLVEEKLRALETQATPVQGVYSTGERVQHVQLTYQSHEGIQVIEHTGSGHGHVGSQQTVIEEAVIEEMEVPLPLMAEEHDHEPGEDSLMSQLLSSAVLPPVGQTQTVSTSLDDSSLPVKTEQPEEGSCSEPGSPRPTLVLRIPSVIEQAMKAEPKVEVERLPPVVAEDAPPSSTSRQNLETIVEAIRHLEGDHLFNDIPSPPGHRLQPVQDAPLALTTKHQTSQRLVKVDMNPYLKYHTSQSLHPAPCNLQQQRPGVIVIKNT